MRRHLSILAVTSLPLLLTSELWVKVWHGVRPHAWDGSGHLALVQLYNQKIFPDTFGWLNNFFGGMPFPNFYPPLFYWLVSLLSHTHLISFITAFKIVLTLPTILMPASIWALAWRISDKNRPVATVSAVAVLPLLLDYRFYSGSGLLMGLSYTSTFLFGLYTQTLGFVLLLAWYTIYASRRAQPWRVALAAALLTLALLANFFASNLAALFIIATVVYDLVRLRRAPDFATRQQEGRLLIAHLASPLIGACLTLFWLAPVLSAREYIPSSPTSIPFNGLASGPMSGWYVLAAAGAILWLRRPTGLAWPYLATCLALAGAILSAGLAPAWLPLHSDRLITMFNFLLAVPVGQLFAHIFRLIERGLNLSLARQSEKRNTPRRETIFRLLRLSQRIWPACAFAVVALLAAKLIRPPSFELAFYQTDDSEVIDPILRFAQQHRDGRYLVETPPFEDRMAAHDGRAIGAYLGAQGNETLSLFFREASPSVIFCNALVRVMSVNGDATNISSVLIDDKDFDEQPVATHLAQARFIGVRYLVMRSPWAKNRLERRWDIKARQDFGDWSIFELQGEPIPPVRTLAYKPALVVSGLSLKQRRNNAYEFVRFAEEQFIAGWFDVLLARSPGMKLDHLDVPTGFGALVIESYEYDDENVAYERLRAFAQQHPLLLLGSESPLFRRIQNSIVDFPQAEIIDRKPEAPGPWLTPGPPTTSYGASSIRRVWTEIRRILNERKVATTAPGEIFNSEFGQSMIGISPVTPLGDMVPVLISTTYHPNWQRADGDAVYAATPFFMLTFVREPTQLVFARRPFDWAGLIVSALTLLLLCSFLLWYYRRQLLGAVKRAAHIRNSFSDHATTAR
jgi:hypothetical protein